MAGKRFLMRKKMPQQICIQHILKILEGIIEEVGHGRRTDRGSVIDEHVEPTAKSVERRGDEPLDILRFADVGFDCEHLALRRDSGEFIAQLLQWCAVPRRESEAGRSLFCENFCKLATKSLRRARDQNLFALKLSHCSSRKSNT